MLDRCRITRDEQGSGDDVLDRATFKLTPPSPDTTTVYEGPCMLGVEVREREEAEGGGDTYRRRWRIRIPVSADLPLHNDVATMTEVHEQGDQSMVDREFKVITASGGTFAVTRKVTVEDLEHATVRRPSP